MSRPINIQVSQKCGGNGGQEFRPQKKVEFNPNLRVTKVRARYGDMLDSLQFVLSDGYNTYELEKIGGNGGNATEWEVPQGQYITRIFVTHNQFITSVQFVLSGGNSSPIFGKRAGQNTEIPLNGNLLAYGGRAGSIIDQIQFYSWN